ncbi:sensor histidine kinase [Sulfitobacter guttiformis]|uniref:histidine kinase n=1 Tax=Sulfitobacter guttiformis TaxID=74349 RepID=A0A420DK88_9RHOB|nr:histidine kinase N-terminal 7TM domain-containing protein [Sulfitobacter guttiformis]KIN71532.1 Signal transduction histidine kinase [Sulfitobacter guttiformis KCTC 32187]RKE94629.1 phospho-acceptor domain-containing protein [Sulfitobacter guttiformis]
MLEPAFWAAAGVSAIAALVLFWMSRFQRFQGKLYYSLTFVAMIWTLLMVGLEAASNSAACQLQWATLAWLGNGLVPVAWCFFVYDYIDNKIPLGKRTAGFVLTAIPLIGFLIAATNQWHLLFYTDKTVIPSGENYIKFAHGPAFFAIIAILYAFVAAAIFRLARAFREAKPVAWPLLAMLIFITLTPLTANAAYIGLGFTFFGLDPTAFMFTLGILSFTWMLVTNKTMDMAFVGQSLLFNTMSEPVVLVDRYRNISLMNAAAKDIGLHSGSASALSKMIENINYLEKSEKAVHLTLGQRFYEPRARPIESPLDPTGSELGWSITFIDITDRIATNAALEEALKQADSANRAKDEFISVVSHELRTPLTSLTGGLTLALSGRLGDVPDPIRSLLNIAHRNGGRLSRLIENILLAQKIEVDALTLESKPVDLGLLLKESFEENKMFAAEREVQLALKSIMPAVIIGDAFAIRQIIDNLISNAIKFSDPQGVVEGSITTAGSRVKLSIKNGGRSIPEGMESKVFGRFEQIENSGQSATQGSGLGLHISKKLAKQMFGDIFYESLPSIGTTFNVEFQLGEKPTPKAALLVSSSV